MERYTKKDCERAVIRLAELLGKPIAAWKQVNGDIKANIGAWTCDYNSIYGGAIVEEIINKGGGITHPLGEGRMKPYEFCRMIGGINELIHNKTLKVV